MKTWYWVLLVIGLILVWYWWKRRMPAAPVESPAMA